MVLFIRKLIGKMVHRMSSLFFSGNVLKTCKLEVSCYRPYVEEINLWNHPHRFVPSSHQTAPRSPSSFSIISTTTIVKPSESPEQKSVNTTSAPNRMTRLSTGKLFDKNLCIWCMEPDESIKKKKKISQNPFYRLEQKKSWRHICACTPFLTDKEMQDRILGIIALLPKDDPFAADIHYHKRCWDKYISNIITKKCREQVQVVKSKEVDAVFIDHVQKTVCQLNELRILKALLKDYHNFSFNLSGEEKVCKTSYIKTITY